MLVIVSSCIIIFFFYICYLWGTCYRTGNKENPQNTTEEGPQSWIIEFEGIKIWSSFFFAGMCSFIYLIWKHGCLIVFTLSNWLIGHLLITHILTEAGRLPWTYVSRDIFPASFLFLNAAAGECFLLSFITATLCQIYRLSTHSWRQQISMLLARSEW